LVNLSPFSPTSVKENLPFSSKTLNVWNLSPAEAMYDTSPDVVRYAVIASGLQKIIGSSLSPPEAEKRFVIGAGSISLAPVDGFQNVT